MNWSAVVASFRTGVRRVAGERTALVGQVIVYWVLLVSYGVLFRGISDAAVVRFGLTQAQLVWYFVLTQAVVACCYLHYRELERDVRSGAVEMLLLRPVPFWQLRMAEWSGQYLMRMVVILPAGAAAAWAISGSLPPHPALALALAFPCLWMSGVLFLCLHFVVGCSAAWFDPAEPVYRLWQKSLYLLGARSWPLLLYPAWAQTLSWFTPFPAVLAVPGNLASGILPGRLALELGGQVLWVALGLAGTRSVANALGRPVRCTA